MAKTALGKGLGALINHRVAAPQPAEERGERVQNLALSEIVPTPLQPRTEFHAEELTELVASIREHGIIQPLIVRKRAGKYELIAGERRWRAAKEVGLAEAPAIVREASDQEVLELALIENLQRADLNAIEEATAFARLAREFGLKQEEIATKVGKSRASVANSMRLLDLDPQVQTYLAHDRISVGHAKILLSLKSREEQLLIAELILRHGYTVRDTERVVSQHRDGQSGKPGGKRSRHTDAAHSPSVLHLQNRLQQHLATHVLLRHGEKKGRIEIEYYGLDDLARVLSAIGLPQDE